VQVTLIELDGDGRAVCKRYFFPRFSQRGRGLLRHTLLGTPKPVREARNLLRLDRCGVPVVVPTAWAVERSVLGVVRDGWILTPFLRSGHSLQELMQAGRGMDAETWRAIGASIRGIHAAGCWYRTLCARNLLVGEDGKLVRWIDPSKAHWKTGPLSPSLASADLQVFWCPWRERAGQAAWEAFRKGYGKEGILPGWGRPWPRVDGAPERWMRKAVARELRRAAREGAE